MKLPISWLNEYVKVDDILPEILSEKLVNIGFEVEEIIYTGAGIENVKTGKIIEIKPHEKSEKLLICTVDLGNEKTIILTGANNVKTGDVVPVAVDGATLPNNINIVSKPLMGVMSHGMLCSGKELNIDDSMYPGASVDGILILPSNTQTGIDIRKIIGLDDYILDISLTANRPDCQSVYGMAREIGVMLEREVKPLNLNYKTVKTDKNIKIKISDFDKCTRYCGRIIENIKIEKSPVWMRKKLRLAGHNSINNIVDITNYVLTEIGQPMHAFDITQISGGINIRNAKTQETIKALDGNSYNLTENMLVIADDEKALAIAGVMGGIYSGINNGTSCVFLETARFARGNIRQTSRALGLRSDSSARYEKGVDYESIDIGRERALALFAELNCGNITDAVCEDGIKKPENKIIKTSSNQICGLLGIKIETDKIVKILSSLKIGVKRDGESLTCKIPLFREDIDNFTDLAEEVIRFYGYGNISSTLFRSSKTIAGGIKLKDKNIQSIKNLLVGKGAFEIITYSFINSNEFNKLELAENDKLRNVIKIFNPLSEEYSVMRTELIGSMLNSVNINLNRKNDNFRLFEIARAYIPKSLPLCELPYENETLTLAFSGKNEDFYSIKSVISEILKKFKVDYTLEYSKKSWLHNGISADIIVNGEIIGSFGKIHPVVTKNYEITENIYLAEVCLEGFVSKSFDTVKYIPLPKYPNVERDIAVIVSDEYSVGRLKNCIRESAGELFEDITLFDIYKGGQIEKDFKSVAFSIKLRSKEHTLSDSEIQNVMNNIIEKLKEQFNAVLRA